MKNQPELIQRTCGECREATQLADGAVLCPVSSRVMQSEQCCCYSIADLCEHRDAAWFRVRVLDRMIQTARPAAEVQAAIDDCRGITRRPQVSGGVH